MLKWPRSSTALSSTSALSEKALLWNFSQLPHTEMSITKSMCFMRYNWYLKSQQAHHNHLLIRVLTWIVKSPSLFNCSFEDIKFLILLEGEPYTHWNTNFITYSQLLLHISQAKEYPGKAVIQTSLKHVTISIHEQAAHFSICSEAQVLLLPCHHCLPLTRPWFVLYKFFKLNRDTTAPFHIKSAYTYT